MLASVVAIAYGQSFNIDINADTDPELGGGPPSNAFGAASGQVGHWNAIPLLAQQSQQLRDITGALTGAQLEMSGAFTGLAFRFEHNTGDHARLMNDAARVGEFLTYTLTGIASGRYRVFTYSANPTGQFGEAFISVSGSSSGPQRVAGNMAGNQFEYLRTHSIHDTEVLGSTLTLHATGQWPNAYVTGFQVVAVPEPASIVGCALGLAFLFRRRRAVESG